MNHLNNKRGFGILAGLLLALIILSFLYYFSSTTYFYNPVVNEERGGIISRQKIFAPGHKAVLNGMLEDIKEIEKQQIKQGENLVGHYVEMIESGK